MWCEECGVRLELHDYPAPEGCHSAEMKADVLGLLVGGVR